MVLAIIFREVDSSSAECQTELLCFSPHLQTQGTDRLSENNILLAAAALSEILSLKKTDFCLQSEDIGLDLSYAVE